MSLFWNKVFGAALATPLIIMGVNELSGAVFSGGGHGGHHGEEVAEVDGCTANYAYCLDVATASVDDTIEVIFDLGALLASADVSRGERSFNGKCSSCHTVEKGGPNGTGPNLWNVVGADVGAHEGFGYSGAFEAYPGAWTYDKLNAYLENPRGTISGTAMSFGGLRKEGERMNVIAYLSTLADSPVAFPEPLPVVEEALEGDAAAIVSTTPEADAVAQPTAIVADDVVDGDAPAPGTETETVVRADPEQPEVTVGADVDADVTIEDVVDAVEGVADDVEDLVDGETPEEE